MSIPRAVWSFSIVMMVLSAGVVSAQEYPNKPIRILAGTGGVGNFVSRLISPVLTDTFGQQVIVDNRAGVLGEIASRAPADGYTLLIDSGTFWLGPSLQKMSYDPVRDFSPITLATTSPNILVVHPSVAANSVRELIALAKAKPGVLNFGSGGAGGTPHLSGELFKSMAGINIVHVPYKSVGPAVIDLIGGQIQLIIGSAPSVAPHVKSGKLRALAVTSLQPSPQFPGLPTVATTLPGYESGTLQGMFAPAKTPAAIVNRLHREIVRALNIADIKEKLFIGGAEVVGNSPEEFSVQVKSEIARWGKVIKDIGLRLE